MMDQENDDPNMDPQSNYDIMREDRSPAILQSTLCFEVVILIKYSMH